MKKVIVTGANGFIGLELLHELSKESIQVIAVIRNRNISKIENIRNVSVVYCELDNIRKIPQIISDRDIDACIHLAWEGSTGDARGNYEIQLLNVKYALDLIDALAEMNIKRFIGAGTLAEKDVLNYHLKDGSSPNVTSIYGVAKISMHFMTKAECSKHGIEHIWCYLSNTYGIGNYTDNFVNFASKIMLMGKRAAFTSCEQMYDFVYVTDTARGIFCAAKSGKKNTAYYIGSTTSQKLKKYVQIIRNTIDPSIKLYFGEIPFYGVSLSTEEFDCSKLITDTGYQPQIKFEEGIQWTIDWLKNEMLLEKNNLVKRGV